MSKHNKRENLLEVTIEKIVPNGYGLGFAEGLTVFVSLAAPGDRLRVKINQQKGKTAFGEIVEIITPAPDRIKPPCPYFGRCGGCDFQQLEYGAQLRAKVGIVRDCLTRIGKIDYSGEIEIIASPRAFGYRSRAQWHAETRARRIGYFRRHSHDVIDVETCPIITDELQATLTDLRASIDWQSFLAGRVEFEAASAGGQVSVYSAELVEPTAEISFQLDENRYFYDAQSFFQGNLFLIDSLVETALRGAQGRLALDLYCGVGLFTLPLARRFAQVLGVESSEKAIESARKNLEHARLESAEFFAEAVGEWLKSFVSRHLDFGFERSDFGLNSHKRTNPQSAIQNPKSSGATENAVDFILLDPPRAGTEKETIEQILKIRPAHISYVSCEPSTLARDLQRLCESLYEIESITALDLFPQTHHVETVVHLKLKS